MKRTLSLIERETHLMWNESEHSITLDTASPAMIRKMDKLVDEFPEVFKCTFVDEIYDAKKYAFPSKYVSIRKPRVITEELRERLSAMGKKANAKHCL